MRFSTSVLFAAVAAISQVSAAIRFSAFPATAVPSTPTTLKWTGGDTTNTITITLKKADTVVAVLLQRNGQANSFDWTPAGSLASGNDYTLEISQGTDTSDTPQFSVGAATTSSATTSSAEATTSASATVTSLSTVEVTTTAAPITTVAPVTTVGNVTSSGSIFPISTLTTLSVNATSTVGSGSNSTATGSVSGGATPTSTITSSNGAASVGSSLTLLLGAAAAIVFLC